MGTVEIFDVYMHPYRLRRNIHVYLPDGWESGEERYPVMYMYDGHNLFDDEMASYGKSWGMRDFLDQWDQKIIVVGIECNHEGNRRLQEFCPCPFIQCHSDLIAGIRDTGLSTMDWIMSYINQPKDGPGSEDDPEIIMGTGLSTVDWIVGYLKPFIDRRFPTRPEREFTGIGGSSMGGLMSIYTIAHASDTFSRAACLSSTLFCTHEFLQAELSRTEFPDDTFVYMSWGTDEANEEGPLINNTMDNLALASQFVEKGAVVYPYLQPNGRHCEADWETQVPRFMEFLWK